MLSLPVLRQYAFEYALLGFPNCFQTSALLGRSLAALPLSSTTATVPGIPSIVEKELFSKVPKTCYIRQGLKGGVFN